VEPTLNPPGADRWSRPITLLSWQERWNPLRLLLEALSLSALSLEHGASPNQQQYRSRLGQLLCPGGFYHECGEYKAISGKEEALPILKD
jgi:hypothetical protein